MSTPFACLPSVGGMHSHVPKGGNCSRDSGGVGIYAASNNNNILRENYEML